MWWRRTTKSDTSVNVLRGALAAAKRIVEAENDGRKAWRILVVNAMLAEEFHKPGGRRYRWNVSELSQLSGIEIERMSDRDAREQND